MPSKQKKSRFALYAESKAIAEQIAIDEQTIKDLWHINKTKTFWKNKLTSLKRDLKTRDNNLNKIKNLAEELNTITSILPILNKKEISKSQAQNEWRRIRNLNNRRNRSAVSKVLGSTSNLNDYETFINNILSKNIMKINEQQSLRVKDNLQSYVTLNNLRVILEVNYGLNRNNETIHLNNNDTYIFLRNLMENGGVEINDLPSIQSDALTRILPHVVNSIKFSIFRRPEGYAPPEQNGAFFPYISSFPEDLTRYQIFREKDITADEGLQNREHCLIHALKLNDVTQEEINKVKSIYKGSHESKENSQKIGAFHIKKNILTEVAQITNRNIVLYYTEHSKKNEGQEKIRTKNYPNVPLKNDNPKIFICLLENHFFKYDKNTKYSIFSINNYDEVKDEENFHEITAIKKIKDSKSLKNYFYPKKAERRVQSTERKMNSMILIKTLLKNGHFHRSKLLNNFAERVKNESIKNELYIDLDTQQRPYEKVVVKDTSKTHKSKSEPKLMNTIFADCESFVTEDAQRPVATATYHKLYLLGYTIQSEDTENDIRRINQQHEESITHIMDVNDYENEQHLLYQFIRRITYGYTRDARVFFHNLKYDIHLLMPFIKPSNIVKKDNQWYSVKFTMKNCEIELRDSMKVLNFSIRAFQKNLELPEWTSKKEAINYSFYTPETSKQTKHSVAEYIKNLKLSEIPVFFEALRSKQSSAFDYHGSVTANPQPKNIQELEELIKKLEQSQDTFNAVNYYKYYLRYDCIVLKWGYINFCKLTNENAVNSLKSDVRIEDCLTTASHADKLLASVGSFENVYEVNKDLKAYIQLATVGGRTSLSTEASNQKCFTKSSLVDLDVNSMYPAAMHFISEENGGVPTGPCRWLSQIECELYDASYYSKHYARLTVEYISTSVKHQLGMIPYKSDDGIINWVNELPEGAIIETDSEYLTQLVKFCGLKYKVVKGLIWDSDTKPNPKMGQTINKLYNFRKQAKREKKQALQLTIKTTLNSPYGKTIQRSSNYKESIQYRFKNVRDENGRWIKVKNENFDHYFYKNFNTIISREDLNENAVLIKQMYYDNSFNRAQIGNQILSRSKRIMNELIFVCTTLGVNIYYSDTDSIHIQRDDLEKVIEQYEKEFNKPLMGKELGLFSSDFEMSGVREETIECPTGIFLAKKIYADLLIGRDEDGNVKDTVHFRMKGVTKEGVINASKKYKSMKKIKEILGSVLKDLGSEVASKLSKQSLQILCVYKELADGKTLKFILNPFDSEDNAQKAKFVFNSFGVYTPETDFTRTVKV